ncbi:MAG: hypothetical protein ACJ78Q_06160 [Chloroflexia bacterium]
MMTEPGVNNTASTAQTVPEGSPTPTPADGAERVYPISREGRRQAFILLLGVATIWIFALWSLITILQDGVTGVEWVSLALMLGLLLVAPVVAWVLLEEANSRLILTDTGLRYRSLAGIDLEYAWDDITGLAPTGRKSRIARFFLGDDAPAPATTDTGAQTEPPDPPPAVAVAQQEPTTHAGAEEADAEDVEAEDELEPETLLLSVRLRPTARIPNLVVNLLHQLGHGPTLPIYGALENRPELLAELERHGVLRNT